MTTTKLYVTRAYEIGKVQLHRGGTLLVTPAGRSMSVQVMAGVRVLHTLSVPPRDLLARLMDGTFERMPAFIGSVPLYEDTAAGLKSWRASLPPLADADASVHTQYAALYAYIDCFINERATTEPTGRWKDALVHELSVLRQGTLDLVAYIDQRRPAHRDY